MSNPTISIICALAENRTIGKESTLLWKIPEDMQRFRQITAGHPIIMGRKTYESIGQPLPNRTNIIITRDETYKATGCIVVNSFDEALEQAKKVEHNEIFIIGGGEIYRQAMPITDKLYLTIIKGSFEGDTFFPDYSDFTKEIFKEERTNGEYTFTFINLER